jgi:hypothetical protein
VVGPVTGRDEDGIAMVVATLLGVLLLLTAGTVVAVASRDVLHTRRGAALLAARGAAEAALDDLAQRAATDASAVERAAAEDPVWTTVDAFGRHRACSPADDTCSRLAVRLVQVRAGDTERHIEAAVAEATGRAGCRRTGRCVEARVQQRLDRRPALDFLVQTDLELVDPDLLPAGDDPGHAGFQRERCEADADGRRLLAAERPAGCVVPAWFGAGASTGSDRADGPVHTNDDVLPTCGTPVFLGPVETTAAPGETGSASASTTFRPVDAAACGVGGSADTSRAELRTAPAISLPPDVRHLDAVASDGHGLRYPGPDEPAVTEAAVTLRPDGRIDVLRRDAAGGTLCSCPVAAPDSGVLFVDAPTVRVMGVSRFPLTIAVTGTAVVDGDLGVASGTDPSVSVGVIADGPVRLQMANRGGQTVVERHLERVALVSLHHTIVTDRWDDPTVCQGGCPALVLHGAIAARYRPLIGSYDSTTGRLAGGYRKALQWLPTLAEVTPPYLLSEGRTPWRRHDAVETGAGTDGLVPG